MFSPQDSKDFLIIGCVILALATFGLGSLFYFFAKLIF